MRGHFFKTILGSKFFLMAGILILILLSSGIAKGYLRRQQINQEISSLHQEISKLEKGNQELTSVLDYLQTSKFIESEARTKFGLAQEGESVVVIPKPESNQFDFVETEDGAGLNLWLTVKRWWYFFFS